MIERNWLNVTVLIFICASIISQNGTNAKLASPIIRTQSGALRGLRSISRDGREYWEFLGIPYAKPPLGSLRFEAPEEPEPWTGIRDAYTYGNECSQITIMFESPTGDEDCLFLNVFTPKSTSRDDPNSEDLFPAMVFIHGGLFFEGSANMFRPDYFMDENIVLVTMNYRLGALGFLNTADGRIAGNAGLKDQVMALRWVQKNIEQFGGDPKQVTIFGESAGAASVNFHMISPMSKGLFHKAISESGNALDPWALMKTPRKQSQRFARLTGCLYNNSDLTVECLKNLPISKINEIQMEAKDRVQDHIFHYLPTIEVDSVINPFLTEDPMTLMKNAGAGVPWMTGINSHDGLLLYAIIGRNRTLQSYISDPSRWMSAMRNMLFRPDLSLEQVKLLRQYYFGNSSFNDFDKRIDNYTNIFSDLHFNYGFIDSVRLYSQHSPVYAYQFNYVSEFSFYNIFSAVRTKLILGLEIMAQKAFSWVKKNVFRMELPRYVAAHADELAMLFKLGILHQITPGDRDYVMSKRLVKIWTQFASNETRMEYSNDQETFWKPFDPSSTNFEVLSLNERSGYTNNSAFVGRVKFLKDNGF